MSGWGDLYGEMEERSRVPRGNEDLTPKDAPASVLFTAAHAQAAKNAMRPLIQARLHHIACVRAAAEEQLKQEWFQDEVDAEKARLRAKGKLTFWQKLFPWKLVRRDR